MPEASPKRRRLFERIVRKYWGVPFIEVAKNATVADSASACCQLKTRTCFAPTIETHRDLGQMYGSSCADSQFGGHLGFRGWNHHRRPLLPKPVRFAGARWALRRILRIRKRPAPAARSCTWRWFPLPNQGTNEMQHPPLATFAVKKCRTATGTNQPFCPCGFMAVVPNPYAPTP